MDYKFTRVSEKSYIDIQKLKLSSMGYLQEFSEIKKKFDTNCFGKKNIGFFAHDLDGNLAAYYGVFPMKVVNNGVESVVAQSGDTMTDPNHRKRGLFIKLAKETYKLAENEGVEFIFGFPNEFSYPGFKNKLDWEFFGNMQEFSIETKAIPFCELAKKYSFFRPMYKWLLNNNINKYKLDISVDSIKGFSHKKSDFFFKKDLNFYSYKSGDYKYIVEIDGFKLFIKAQTHLYVGDIAHFEKERINDFMNALKKLSKIVLSRKVIINISKTHWLYEVLKTEIEPKESLPIGFYKYSTGFPFEKLIYSMSDSDTF